jgi:hypothetical protein
MVTLSDVKPHRGAKNRHPSPVLKPHVFWGTLQNNPTLSTSGQQPSTLARVQQQVILFVRHHFVIVTLSDRKNHNGDKNRDPSPMLKPHVFWGTLQNNPTLSISGQQPSTLARVQQPITLFVRQHFVIVTLSDRKTHGGAKTRDPSPMLKPHVFWGTLRNHPTLSTSDQQPSTLARIQQQIILFV